MPYHYAIMEATKNPMLKWVTMLEFGLLSPSKVGSVEKTEPGTYVATRKFGSHLVKTFQAPVNKFCIDESATCSAALSWACGGAHSVADMSVPRVAKMYAKAVAARDEVAGDSQIINRLAKKWESEDARAI